MMVLTLFFTPLLPLFNGPWFIIRGSYLDKCYLSILYWLRVGVSFPLYIYAIKDIIPGEISQFCLLGMMNSRCMTTPVPLPTFLFRENEPQMF